MCEDCLYYPSAPARLLPAHGSSTECECCHHGANELELATHGVRCNPLPPQLPSAARVSSCAGVWAAPVGKNFRRAAQRSRRGGSRARSVGDRGPARGAL